MIRGATICDQANDATAKGVGADVGAVVAFYDALCGVGDRLVCATARDEADRSQGNGRLTHRKISSGVPPLGLEAYATVTTETTTTTTTTTTLSADASVCLFEHGTECDATSLFDAVCSGWTGAEWCNDGRDTKDGRGDRYDRNGCNRDTSNNNDNNVEGANTGGDGETDDGDACAGGEACCNLRPPDVWQITAGAHLKAPTELSAHKKAEQTVSIATQPSENAAMCSARHDESHHSKGGLGSGKTATDRRAPTEHATSFGVAYVAPGAACSSSLNLPSPPTLGRAKQFVGHYAGGDNNNNNTGDRRTEAEAPTHMAGRPHADCGLTVVTDPLRIGVAGPRRAKGLRERAGWMVTSRRRFAIDMAGSRELVVAARLAVDVWETQGHASTAAAAASAFAAAREAPGHKGSAALGAQWREPCDIQLRDPRDDPRLACAGLVTVDGPTRLVAGMLLTAGAIYALYGRLLEARDTTASSRRDPHAAAFLSLALIAERDRTRALTEGADVAIGWSNDSIRWYVGGAAVRAVSALGQRPHDMARTLAVEHGGADRVVRPSHIRVSLGTFAFVDASWPPCRFGRALATQGMARLAAFLDAGYYDPRSCDAFTRAPRPLDPATEFADGHAYGVIQLSHGLYLHASHVLVGSWPAFGSIQLPPVLCAQRAPPNGALHALGVGGEITHEAEQETAPGDGS